MMLDSNELYIAYRCKVDRAKRRRRARIVIGALAVIAALAWVAMR